MPEMMHDLLNEPLLTWRDAHGTIAKTTLPGLLARLGDGSCVDFPRTRPHQHHPWAMFLTQLAVHALKKGGATDPQQSEQWWREQLLALSGGAGEAWQLVVEDLTKPAFLQPPVPEGALVKKAKEGKKGEPWSMVDSPDDLDVLFTTRMHDLKRTLAAPEDVELWTYALCTVQTMDGYPNKGSYGVARMNSGSGSRPRVGLAPGLDPGSRFTRDVTIMFDGWDALTTTRGFRADGTALVWLLPWDGVAGLPLISLAPHFVEICKRLRLESARGGIVARRTTSEGRRCAPEVERGDVGDAWIPISQEKASAFTVSGNGFSYPRFAELVFQDGWLPALAQEPRTGDTETMWMVASALARGQSTTDGIHERRLRLLAPVRRRLARPETRDALAGRAKERVARAELVGTKVLYPALCALVARDEVPKPVKKLIEAAREDFNRGIDEVFFTEFFDHADSDDSAAKMAWDVKLLALAEHELARAIDTWPLPDARHYRAVSAAIGMFKGCARKQAPDAWAALHRRDVDADQPTGDAG